MRPTIIQYSALSDQQHPIQWPASNPDAFTDASRSTILEVRSRRLRRAGALVGRCRRLLSQLLHTLCQSLIAWFTATQTWRLFDLIHTKNTTDLLQWVKLNVQPEVARSSSGPRLAALDRAGCGATLHKHSKSSVNAMTEISIDQPSTRV